MQNHEDFITDLTRHLQKSAEADSGKIPKAYPQRQRPSPG
jgi:hypothetical protein